MRLMIMFDLPVETSEERKEYRKFRKNLINEGFIMIQYSVYVRVCVNKKSAEFTEKRIYRMDLRMRKNFTLHREIPDLKSGKQNLESLALESAGISGSRNVREPWRFLERNFCFIQRPSVMNRFCSMTLCRTGVTVCRGMRRPILCRLLHPTGLEPKRTEQR